MNLRSDIIVVADAGTLVLVHGCEISNFISSHRIASHLFQSKQTELISVSKCLKMSNQPFKVQLNSLDSYVCAPKHAYRYAKNYEQVSVIRVYGTISTGHSICVHIHGVLPYFFISTKTEWNDIKEIDKFAAELHVNLERLTRQAFSTNPNQANVKFAKFKYIAKVEPCKSTAFYGYHVGYSIFFKISLLTPYCKNKVLSLLAGTSVSGGPFITYEAHASYMIQFMTDFNLYGCDWLDIKGDISANKHGVHFRRPIFNNVTDEFYEMKLTDEIFDYVNQYMLDNDGNLLSYPRISDTFLEIDIRASDILNRKALSVKDLHKDLARLASFKNSTSFSSDPTSRLQYMSSVKSLWRDDAYQRRIRDFGSFEKPAEVYRNYIPLEWSEQADLDGLFKYCRTLSFRNCKRKNLTLSNYVVKKSYLDNIKTPFNLIEADLRKLGDSPSELLKDAKEEIFQDFSFDTQDEDTETRANSPHPANEAVQDVIPKRPSDDELKNIPEQISVDEMSFTFDSSFIELSTKPESDQALNSTESAKRRKRFPSTNNSRTHIYSNPPPNRDSLAANIDNWVIPRFDYPHPFYGDRNDVPSRPFYNPVTRKKIIVRSQDPDSLQGIPIFKDGTSISKRIKEEIDENYEKRLVSTNDAIIKGSWNYKGLIKTYKYVPPKPSFAEIKMKVHRLSKFIKTTDDYKSKVYASKIEFLTPKYTTKSTATPVRKVKRRPDDFNSLPNLNIEIHRESRPSCSCDFKIDSVKVIFWKIDKPLLDLDIVSEGILMVSKAPTHDSKRHRNVCDIPIQYFNTELDMFHGLCTLVRTFDPDLLSSWDSHSNAWGYIINRCATVHNFNIINELSRLTLQNSNPNFTTDSYGISHGSAFTVPGRYLINIWRHVSKEIVLTGYSFEKVVAQVLNYQIPHYSYQKLDELFEKGSPAELSLFFDYYTTRVCYDLEVLEQLDIVYRIVEQARLGGVDFYSVFYRGSQFKVESFVFRLGKAENFMILSPSKVQVRKQRALECIPLVMEPTSGFYKSPMVVLDFQSLYPSIIIAYNYCYSTCLGPLRGYNPVKPSKFGVTDYKSPEGLLHLLSDEITVSPNGLMFVKQEVRKSLLANMLQELLDTRQMVKSTMKLFEKGDQMKRVYDNRQLALKLIANVTYGYTSASFSGRMPCSDIADAIVQTARETLETMIRYIESEKQWNAKVVYGDTDSLFIYFAGRSKSEAFALGKEIAKRVTERSPNPVTLKFEKVYHPSVLIAKKRYVGYMYEAEDQLEPIFEAKGIETVRRDGIPAQSKITEKALRILFDTADISRIKSYVKEQFQKTLSNKVSIQDFCFAKEVKIGNYKSEQTMPAGALLASKKMAEDSGYEPQYKERIPFLIVKGNKNARLRDKAVLLQDIISNPDWSVQLDGHYYISKVLIPPLERIFNLMGVDVKQWYDEIPKSGPSFENFTVTAQGLVRIKKNTTESSGLNALEKYLQVGKCISCDNTCQGNICEECKKDPESIRKITLRRNNVESQYKKVLMLCRNCSISKAKGAGTIEEIWCDNTDCNVYFERVKRKSKRDVLVGALDI